MSGTKTQLVALSVLCLVFTSVLLFELGMLYARENHDGRLEALEADLKTQVTQATTRADELNNLVASKDAEIKALAEKKEELNGHVTELSAQVAGLSDSKAQFPFTVPSTGTVGSKVSTYLDDFKGGIHYGVDIWTSTANGGAISSHRGNPVYSACSGVVESFQPDNGGVTIKCDYIPTSYNVPARKVYTYYGHMANALTKEQFIYLERGQRVAQGQFIGYQGDLSMFTPGMRNVHLHFSVFSGFKERDGSQDPCKYIGGSCTKVGEFFKVTAK